jgi:serine kinase of HPr protein (carbohydrate metabolism regulator)
MGVFLPVGPSGAGKTETALADVLYEGREINLNNTAILLTSTLAPIPP